MLAAWLVIAGVAGSFAGKLDDVQKNDPASFLPGDAESVRALDLVEDFPSGQLDAAVVVYAREGGLTPADRRAAQADRRALASEPLPSAEPALPLELSRDGSTALFVIPIRTGADSDIVVDTTEEVRERVGDGGDGLEVAVSGPAGFATDAINVFQSINGTLLLVTLSLVFVLLVLIYRSPIFWLVPLIAVVFAEVASRGLGYAIAEAGVTVNGQSAGILPVLVFGAGTDYALLIVARYREELRRYEDKHDALRRAMRSAGPVIFASGLTVIAALLTLSIAEVNATAGLGPIGAMGIALAMVAMLTLLPALLAITGRHAFWPFIPRVGAEGADESHGFWRRVGDRVLAAPRRIAAGATAVLAVLSLGLVYLNSDLTSATGFIGEVEAVEGQDLISKAFPAGTNAPVTVVVQDAERVGAVRRALAEAPGVATVSPRVERGTPGARFDLILEPPPYSQRAFDTIPRLRGIAKGAGGDSVLIGGPTAEERDVNVASGRDNRRIVPLVLVVVFLILVVLLRSLVAPLMLIATVIASFAAALGAGAFLFEKVLGFEGMDPGLPLLSFVFLVALGIDYNIFLMARVREEALEHGTRQGMLRGLAVTGAVVTSAGIVLAGTFSTLAVLPLVTLTELGVVIALGVLLDTFLVRSVLVPALVFDWGARVWWPSKLARRE